MVPPVISIDLVCTQLWQNLPMQWLRTSRDSRNPRVFPKRPFDFFTIMMVSISQACRCATDVDHPSINRIDSASLASLSRHFLGASISSGTFLFAMYLSNQSCCNTASILRCYGIQLLGLSNEHLRS